VFEAMPPVQFLTQMLNETGSKIHYIRTENLELKIETFKFISIDYKIDLKSKNGKEQVLEMVKKMDVFLFCFV
jgi:hypothetical protein